MADIDPGYSQITPLVQAAQPQGSVSPGQQAQTGDTTNSTESPGKLSSIEVAPDNEPANQDSSGPTQSTPTNPQAAQTNPSYYPPTIYSYTTTTKAPAEAAASPSDGSTEEGDDRHMGLTGIRVFLASLAIILLCFFSAGATYMGAQAYYSLRTKESCMTVLEKTNGDSTGPLSRTPSDAMDNEMLPGIQGSDNVYPEEGEPIQCEVSHQKDIFPNLDFALMGYHILRGFPLTSGTDTGLTKPIFQKTYDKQMLSSDGHHSVPDGVHITQDISCLTSFTTQVIEEAHELELYLGNLVRFSGSGWGPPFSANSHFRELLYGLENDNEYLIISSLSCQAYTINLDRADIPPLHEAMRDRVSDLITTDNDNDVIDFVTYYGTHYLKSVTYGAKYFYIYHIRKLDYISLMEASMTTLDIARYVSMVRFFSEDTMDEAWTKRVDDFNSKVRVETIAIGVTPQKTPEVTTWFKLVKAQPMPIAFELAPIEDLFSGVTGTNLFLNIEKARQKLNMIRVNHQIDIYTNAMQRSCVVHNLVVPLPDNACLRGMEFTRTKSKYLDCMNLCMNQEDCLAANHDGLDNCKLFTNDVANLDSLVVQLLDGPCHAIILPYRLQMAYLATQLLRDVVWISLTGIRASNSAAVTQYSVSRIGCQNACLMSDATCVATSYHSDAYCTVFTSFDVMTANLTVTGSPESSISFLKLC